MRSNFLTDIYLTMNYIEEELHCELRMLDSASPQVNGIRFFDIVIKVFKRWHSKHENSSPGSIVNSKATIMNHTYSN